MVNKYEQRQKIPQESRQIQKQVRIRNTDKELKYKVGSKENGESYRDIQMQREKKTLKFLSFLVFLQSVDDESYFYLI